MNYDDALKLVRHVLDERVGLDADEVRPESNLREDLGMDSLDAVEMITALEAELGGRMEQEDVEAVQTVEDVVDAIRRHSSLRTTP